MTVTNNKLLDLNKLNSIMINSVNNLLVIIDPNNDFKIIFINESVHKKLLGYRNIELLGKNFLSILHPDDVKEIEKTLKRITQSKDNLREVRIRNKYKRYTWVELKAKRFQSQDNPHIIFLDIHPISKRKSLEEELNQSKITIKKLTDNIPEIRFWKSISPKKYEAALQNSYETLLNIIENIPEFIFWKDTNLVYVGCNENYAKFIGAEYPENVIGKTDEQLFFNERKIADLRNLENNVLKENIAQYHKLESWSPDENTQVLLDTNRIPLHDSTGKVMGILCTYVDITEQTQAERKLKKSEARLRTVIESLPFDFFAIDENGRYDMQNTACKENWGDLIGKKPEEVATDEKILEIWKKNNNRAFNGEIVEGEVSFKVGNEERFCYNIISPIIEDEQIKGIQGVNIDITALKQAEQKLKESEEKFRSLTEQSLMGIAILQDGIFKYFNDQFANVIWHSSEEIKSWGPGEFFKAIHPEDRDFVKEQVLKKKYESDDAITHYFFRGLNKFGDTEWKEIYSKTITYEGKPADFITVIDITGKKEAEEKLKESEKRYHTLYETTPNGIILADLKGTILEINSSLTVLTGFSQEYFVGKNFIKLGLYYGNGLEILIEGFKDLLNQRLLEYMDFQIKCKNSKIKWVRIKSTLFEMNDQTYILAMIYDIHTQKLAEEALRKSEEKYRNLLESSSVGILEINMKNNEISYINPKLLQILGFSRKEQVDQAFILENIHADDIKRMFKSSDEKDLEFRIYDKLGKLKWLSGKKVNQYSEDGELMSLRLWLSDVTEKKMYEDLILEINTNFLNFSTSVQKNFQLLINTWVKMTNGSLGLYVIKNTHNEKITYQVISSTNEQNNYEPAEFNSNIFANEFFKLQHDFPHTFFDLDKTQYAKTDPFLKNYNFKESYGRLIKTENGFNSLLCVFYEENIIVSIKNKLVLFLISDAIEIERRRWQVQRHLEEQNKMLYDINKFKTELFSRTSHELKTPLISIKGFTELLLTLHRSKLDLDTISILEEIRNGSNRLEKTINSLLQGSKLNEERLKLNVTKEDLSFLIRFCVKELKGLIKLRHQSIDLNIHDKMKIKFDKERIYEVLSHLITNAIKYTPPNGKIFIQSEINEDFYVISVEDNGIGLTEEEKDQLFKQFGKIERYGQGWDLGIEGSGLGLYISKKIVELHGGKIWAKSEGRDKGSTFCFSLPKISD